MSSKATSMNAMPITKGAAGGHSSIASSSSAALARPSTLSGKDSDMATQLKLWCLVEGEYQPFSVDIYSDELVESLQVAIQPKCLSLQNLPSDLLELWKLKTTISKKNVAAGYYDEYTKDVMEDNHNWLGPSRTISDVFSEAEVNNDFIQVVVQKPQPGMTPLQDDELALIQHAKAMLTAAVTLIKG
ncbi:hypothetical protein BGZ49_010000 [Haplosporangium sp. Z 27]|nr:hypothetical protein BGZ49_010000 [Haplosporangium sp. Z 27]